MKKGAWLKEVATISNNLNTQDTFTFCLWGPARFIDLFGW